MDDRLDEYRRRRKSARTPEPVPAGPLPRGRNDTFVIQQHHARSLHWDLRLERDGVLVSWAVPRGIPRDPARNHLAVHTEDHPLEYAEFQGEIPAGEYGAGRVLIYDRGTYVTEKWHDDRVVVTFAGTRVLGRYALFRTSGRDWMIHRMDPPPPGWSPMPRQIQPMSATAATRLPVDDDAWAYEMEWPGVRGLTSVDGGRARLVSAGGADLTAAYPRLRAVAATLAPTECLFDGVVVAFDASGRIVRSAANSRPRTSVQYMVFDLLWLDGSSTMDLPYAQRRELLGGLGLTDPHWQVPPHLVGGGKHALRAAREQQLAGVVAKRMDSRYEPGQQSRSWRILVAGRR